MFGLEMKVYTWVSSESFIAKADVDAVEEITQSWPTFTWLQITHLQIKLNNYHLKKLKNLTFQEKNKPFFFRRLQAFLIFSPLHNNSSQLKCIETWN